jgi:hypothetical protein
MSIPDDSQIWRIDVAPKLVPSEKFLGLEFDVLLRICTVWKMSCAHVVLVSGVEEDITTSVV